MMASDISVRRVRSRTSNFNSVNISNVYPNVGDPFLREDVLNVKPGTFVE